jgi:hypothetical protein
MEIKRKNPREEMQIRASFLSNLDAIVVGFPDLTISQHLKGIMRTKGTYPSDLYNLSNEGLLSRTEAYRRELEDNPPRFWGTDYDIDNI